MADDPVTKKHGSWRFHTSELQIELRPDLRRRRYPR